jgi:hypothetical protein
MIKPIGIGIDEIDLQEFKTDFFPYDILINRNKTIYKALGYKRPGCLSCWGFCYKKSLSSYNQIKAKYKDNNKVHNTTSLKADLFQMGGCCLINSKGKIVLLYRDSYYGDHVPENLLTDVLAAYYA